MKKILQLIIFVALVLSSAILKVNASQNNLQGKILLQVEGAGQAWYVDPSSNTRAFLGRPSDAFQVMRELGVGIKNQDLAKIAAKNQSNIDLNSIAQQVIHQFYW